jgi:predicted esterase
VLAQLAAVAAAFATLPGFAPAAAGPAGGAVLSGTFPGSERPGYVYLPPGFTTTKRYPVVFLLHGMRGSPSEFLHGADLLDFADSGIAGGTLPPFIGVMPAAGPDGSYNGEWAGPWERMLVDDVVPWVDANLPALPGPRGRILAGLSAGGFGALDIGLRHPGLFGTIEGWGGYYHPLRDGPFKFVSTATLLANDPTLLAPVAAGSLRRYGTRFFLSTGPAHSHWFKPAQTFALAGELRGLGLPVTTWWTADAHGEWTAQLERGLAFALGGAIAPVARGVSGSAATSAAS